MIPHHTSWVAKFVWNQFGGWAEGSRSVASPVPGWAHRSRGPQPTQPNWIKQINLARGGRDQTGGLVELCARFEAPPPPGCATDNYVGSHWQNLYTSNYVEKFEKYLILLYHFLWSGLVRYCNCMFHKHILTLFANWNTIFSFLPENFSYYINPPRV